MKDRRMSFLKMSRLTLGTAIGLIFASAGASLAADAKLAQPVAQASFDIRSIDTFSGAFLAARTADNDYDYESAITLYRTALNFDAADIEVRERLMICLFMNGNFDEGVAEAEKLKNDPAVERIGRIARGIDAVRKKRFKEAADLLKYSGPNELDRMISSLLMAWGQVAEGKGKEAVQTVETLKGPEWYSIFRNYSEGMIAFVAGDVDTARRKLLETVGSREAGTAASDTYIRAVIALASLETQAGNRRQALDAIATGEAFAPGYAPLQEYRKRIEAGEKLEMPIKDAAGGMASVLFSVGAALNQSLNTAPDRQSAQDIVTFYLVTSHAISPGDADTAILLGGLAENIDKADKAIEWYRKVPEKSPLRRISDLQMGLNLANTGKTEEARKYLKAAIAAEPKDTRGYLAYGSLLSDKKEYAEMATIYDKAVEIIGPFPKRTDWSVFFQRGIAYERLKKWDLAEPNFRKALQLFPDQPQVLNYLGYSWVDMNINLEEGLDMIRKAVDLKPDDGYIVDSLGWAYYRLNRFDDAVEELERAVDLKAGDATINDHLGDAYWRIGRKLEALYQWESALDMKPEAAEIPKIEKKIREGLPPLVIKASAEVSPKDKAVQQAAAELKPLDENKPAAGEADQAKPADSAGSGTDAKPAGDATPSATQEPAVDAAKPAPVADEAKPDATHTVVKGDSLWNIARDMLGDGMRFHEIIDLNPALKRNPDLLRPGQEIKLPETRK